MANTPQGSPNVSNPRTGAAPPKAPPPASKPAAVPTAKAIATTFPSAAAPGAQNSAVALEYSARIPVDTPIWPYLIAIAVGAALFLFTPLLGIWMEAQRTFILAEMTIELQPLNADVWQQFWIFFSFTISLWGLALAIYTTGRFCRRKGLSIWPASILLLSLWPFGMVMIGFSWWWLWLGIVPFAAVTIPILDTGAARRAQRRGSVFTGAFAASFFIFVALLVAYGNTFVSRMALDNKYIISEYYITAPMAQGGIPIRSAPFAHTLFFKDYWWPKGISGLFRPITTFSYWLNYVYWRHDSAVMNQLNPFDYHVVNLALHWLCALLLFVMVRMLSGRFLASLAAALIFVVHPITVESVTNIIGRADILAACCVIGSVLCYVRAVRAGPLTRGAWWAGGLFAGAILLWCWFVYRAPETASTPEDYLRVGPQMSHLPLWAIQAAIAAAMALCAIGAIWILRHVSPAARQANAPRWIACLIGGLILCRILYPLLVPTLVDWHQTWFTGTRKFLACMAIAVVILPCAGGVYWLGRQIQRLHVPGPAAFAGGAIVAGAVFWIWALKCAPVTGALLSDARHWLYGTSIALAALGVACCVWDLLAGGGRAFWLLALLGLTLFGVFAKESAVAGVAAVAACAVVFQTAFGSRPFGKDVGTVARDFGAALLAMGPPLLFMYFMRRYVYFTSSPPEEPFLDNPIRGQTFLTGRMTAVDVAGRLLGKVLWPVHLCADYSWNQIPLFWWTPGWHNTQAVLWLLFFLCLGAFTVWLYFKNKAACFFILFYLIGYAPTANILKVIGAIMAERFMYLPMIGIAAAAGIGIDWIALRLLRIRESRAALPAGGFPVAATASPNKSDKPLPPPPPRAAIPAWLWFGAPYFAALLVIGLYSARSFHRNFDWEEDVQLFESGVKECPNAFRCYQSLAFAYWDELDKHRKPMRPGMPFDRDNLALIDRMITTAESAYPIVSVLPLDKDSSRLYLHLGMYYTEKAQAVMTWDEHDRPIWSDESKVYLREAVEKMQRGVRVDQQFNATNRMHDIQRGTPADEIPDAGMNILYNKLTEALVGLGQLDEARQAADYGLRLAPIDMDSMRLELQVYLNARRDDLAAMMAFEIYLCHPDQKQFLQALPQLIRQVWPDSQPVTPDGHINVHDRATIEVFNAGYTDLVTRLYDSRWFSMARFFRGQAIRSGFSDKEMPTFKQLNRPDPIR